MGYLQLIGNIIVGWVISKHFGFDGGETFMLFIGMTLIQYRKYKALNIEDISPFFYK